MNKADYPIVVRALTEEDGGGYMAVVPDLCGCMSDGETAEQAVTSVLNAMDEWADEAERLGRSIPRAYSQADRYGKELDLLRELVSLQKALIAEHELALDQQTASLTDLRQQVATLSAGIEPKRFDRSGVSSLDDCGRSKGWSRGRDGIITGAGTIVHDVTRKLYLPH